MSVVLLLAVVVGCGRGPRLPDLGPRVDARAYLQALSARPYECANYEPSSDSCETLTTYRPDGESGGDRVIAEGVFAAQPNPVVTVTGTVPLDIRDGKLCGHAKNIALRADGEDPRANTRATGAVRQSMGFAGRMCAEYYRSGDGIYSSVPYLDSGMPVLDLIEEVRLFPTPKRLRYVP